MFTQFGYWYSRYEIGLYDINPYIIINLIEKNKSIDYRKLKNNYHYKKRSNEGPAELPPSTNIKAQHSFDVLAETIDPINPRDSDCFAEYSEQN